jgi:hypothetical protein
MSKSDITETFKYLLNNISKSGIPKLKIAKARRKVVKHVEKKTYFWS